MPLVEGYRLFWQAATLHSDKKYRFDHGVMPDDEFDFREENAEEPVGPVDREDVSIAVGQASEHLQKMWADHWGSDLIVMQHYIPLGTRMLTRDEQDEQNHERKWGGEAKVQMPTRLPAICWSDSAVKVIPERRPPMWPTNHNIARFMKLQLVTKSKEELKELFPRIKDEVLRIATGVVDLRKFECLGVDLCPFLHPGQHRTGFGGKIVSYDDLKERGCRNRRCGCGGAEHYVNHFQGGEDSHMTSQGQLASWNFPEMEKELEKKAPRQEAISKAHPPRSVGDEDSLFQIKSLAGPDEKGQHWEKLGDAVKLPNGVLVTAGHNVDGAIMSFISKPGSANEHTSTLTWKDTPEFERIGCWMRDKKRDLAFTIIGNPGTSVSISEGKTVFTAGEPLTVCGLTLRDGIPKAGATVPGSGRPRRMVTWGAAYEKPVAVELEILGKALLCDVHRTRDQSTGSGMSGAAVFKQNGLFAGLHVAGDTTMPEGYFIDVNVIMERVKQLSMSGTLNVTWGGFERSGHSRMKRDSVSASSTPPAQQISSTSPLGGHTLDGSDLKEVKTTPPIGLMTESLSESLSKSANARSEASRRAMSGSDLEGPQFASQSESSLPRKILSRPSPHSTEAMSGSIADMSKLLEGPHF
jgi:hypothetical protein